jgi:hypothetical protein
MKTWMRFTIIVVAANVAMATSSFAALLDVGLTYPKAAFDSVAANAVDYTYTGPTGLFSISVTPTAVLFANGEPLRMISGTKNLQIQILVDNTGALVGGVAGDDLTLAGAVTEGANTYTGVLLTGEVTGFGFLESGQTDLYDLRFRPTGGALAGLFPGDIAVQVTSEFSTFNNDFTVNFDGQAKGTLGSETTSVPEPGIYGACTGALMLLPLGVSMLRTLRKRQAA